VLHPSNILRIAQKKVLWLLKIVVLIGVSYESRDRSKFPKCHEKVHALKRRVCLVIIAMM
jgi:hypothetical protein